MIESEFDFGRGRGIDGKGGGIVALFLDAELEGFFRDAQEFAEAGNPGLTAEGQGRRRRLEGNVGGGNGDPIFIEHDHRQPASSLGSMRERQKQSEAGD
jgi:hypothetical protein